MKTICPNCGNESKLVPYEKNEEVIVRGEPISFSVRILRCEECGDEFYDLGGQDDQLALAYREFRKKHSMVQPEEIRDFRSRYGLTQQELSRLLGWGGATISRYENGALQDIAHDKVLQLSMDPENLLRLIQDNSSAIQDNKRRELEIRLKETIEEEYADVKRCYEDLLGKYAPDQFSGFLQLDVEKVFNTILFFCVGESVLKTKLNKLLFYSDFLHFKEYAISITGARYVHLTYGPILDNYEFYLAAMIHEDHSLKIDERQFGDYLGEVLVSNVSPDLGSFTNSELRILSLIKEKFEAYSASEISARSHKEKGFQETSDLDYISYVYADSIEI
jgi:putative zinc finger/helix-turn-helix YgiT family protein